MITLTLPEQPEIVKNWFSARRDAQRRVFATAADAISAGDALALRAEDVIGDLRDSLQDPPFAVRRAYEEWAAEYNAIIHRARAARQARINHREIIKIRAQACPRCFTTHAGEC